MRRPTTNDWSEKIRQLRDNSQSPQENSHKRLSRLRSEMYDLFNRETYRVRALWETVYSELGRNAFFVSTYKDPTSGLTTKGESKRIP